MLENGRLVDYLPLTQYLMKVQKFIDYSEEPVLFIFRKDHSPTFQSVILGIVLQSSLSESRKRVRYYYNL